MSSRRNILAAALGMAAVMSSVVVAPEAIAASPTFYVMNTSESPPDGVWFRNSPHTDDTDRVTGHGVYAGDVVQLNCYAFGDAVGPYNDSLWYLVANLTRPTVPGSGARNTGYLNAHYINDGQAADVVDAGVPNCSTTPPAPTYPEGASAFFLPKGHTAGSTANINDLYSKWAPGGCNYGGGVANPLSGRWVSILGGWSNGRLGPVYYLANATADQYAHVHYILLIDPGNTADFQASCESSHIGHVPVSPTLANWLASNSSNRLMILAATATGSDDGMGLTNYYLTTIRQRGLLAQVTICWDDKLGHQAAFDKYAATASTSLISHPSTTCPAHY